MHERFGTGPRGEGILVGVAGGFEIGGELLCNGPGPGNEPSQKVTNHQASPAPAGFAEGYEAAQCKACDSGLRHMRSSEQGSDFEEKL